jgi:diadenosine tetraphosphate (Ap4A) HIT family hydrolase
MNRTWPADWEARKRGESCYFCGDVSTHSFYSGRTSEALLERKGIAKGHAAVVLLLGNSVPHLHVHLVPRYLDDPSPGRPLPWDPSEVPEDEYSRQVRQLQAIGAALER